MKTFTRLDSLPAGTRVLVDANILVYHFGAASEECQRFVQRCQTRDVVAYMPSHIALELLHRLMTLEAVSEGAIAGKDVVKKLAQRPQ